MTKNVGQYLIKFTNKGNALCVMKFWMSYYGIYLLALKVIRTCISTCFAVRLKPKVTSYSR